MNNKPIENIFGLIFEIDIIIKQIIMFSSLRRGLKAIDFYQAVPS